MMREKNTWGVVNKALTELLQERVVKHVGFSERDLNQIWSLMPDIDDRNEILNKLGSISVSSDGYEHLEPMTCVVHYTDGSYEVKKIGSHHD